MKYALPEGRPVTNFIWRSLPNVSDKVARLFVGAAFVLFAIALLGFIAVLVDWMIHLPIRHNPDFGGRITPFMIVGYSFLFFGRFCLRRNFVNPLLANGMSLSQANQLWERELAGRKLWF
jgi:hypothetical protein